MKRILSGFSAISLLLVAAASAAPAGRVLLVDPALSRVDVVVQATMDSFTGHLRQFAPVITLDDAGIINAVQMPFLFRDVSTGNAKRDVAMHDWQQTNLHPDGEFVLSSLTSLQPGRFMAKGRLVFHGLTHELIFPVAVTTDHALYAIDGEAVIDTRDFGLPIIRVFGLLKVDPLVKVSFHLQGRAP
jgi:polyisoprenoid-binding protein YceI